MSNSPGRPSACRSAIAAGLSPPLVEIGLLTRFQTSQLLAGRTSGFFLGQYRILDHIGQGGMGRVFKAEHRTLSRIVAIKVLAPRLLKTARRRNYSAAKSAPPAG